MHSYWYHTNDEELHVGRESTCVLCFRRQMERGPSVDPEGRRKALIDQIEALMGDDNVTRIKTPAGMLEIRRLRVN